MASSALALRYAEALWLAAADAKATDQVLADLAGLKRRLDVEPRLWHALLDPRKSADEKCRELSDALGFSGRLVSNAVRLILARSREQIMREFFSAYLEVHQRRVGIMRVLLESPRALSSEERASMHAALEKATGHKVDLEEGVRPELIAGMRITMDSMRIDGSAQARIQRIAQGLKSVSFDGSKNSAPEGRRK
ncbi:MAG: ATP synthase F1 subunit delta [Planctomycetes bacterium]|nr:ATP synthase F1 subunit delta [Planctomycetota bacterium]